MNAPIEILIHELGSVVDREFGPGPWHAITQTQVDRFAEATGDHQWIHVDPERAAAGPYGRTIAHGYLTLSMLPMLQRELWVVVGAAMGINYGLERVRFPSAVLVGSRVRLGVRVRAVDERPDGSRLVRSVATVEVAGSDRPACVAETLALVLPSPHHQPDS